MAFNWRKFPWTNLHDLNLDWIIQTVKTLEKNLSDALSLVQTTVDAAITKLTTGEGDFTVNKTGNVQMSGNSVKLSKTVISSGSEQLTLHNTTSNTNMGANYNSGTLTLTNNQNSAAGVAVYPVNTPADGGEDNSDFAANVGYVKTAVEAVSNAITTETGNRTSGDAALQSTIDGVIMPLINALQKRAPRVFYFSTTAEAGTLTAQQVDTVRNAIIDHTPVIFVADNELAASQCFYYVVNYFPAPTEENINEGSTAEFRTLDGLYKAGLTFAGAGSSGTVIFDRLGGPPVSGVVDSNNNIIISGSLADGTYTIKYENADGTYTDIGTFDVGATGPVYTNLFDPAAATLNQRWSNSSYAFTTSGGNGYVVSDYIPIPDISNSGIEHILRFRGGTWAGNAGVHYFNASKSVIQASDASSAGVGVTTASDTPTTDGNGVSQLTLGHKNGAYDSAWATAAYIRVTLQVNSAGTAITANDINDIIITIDEPIVN